MKKSKNFQKMVQDSFEQGMKNNKVKLNFKCPFGEFVADSFKCGDTPEEAKKNYESLQKEKTGKPKSDIPKKTYSVDKQKVSDLKNVIDKINKEKDVNGTVSDESKNGLKMMLKEIKGESVSKKSISSNEIERKLFKIDDSIPKNPKEINEQIALTTASASDIYAKMDENLEKISHKVVKFEALSGKVSNENINVIKNNAKKEVKQYVEYLSGNTSSLVRDYIDDVSDLLSSGAMKNVDATDMDNLIRDSVKKLVHQEIESSRKSFSDHGIRHIVGNINRQNEIMGAMGSSDPREKLMASFIMINHDIGYTTPLIRDTGTEFAAPMTSFHPMMSAKILEDQRDIWNKDRIFSSKEYDRIIDIVKTHDSVEIDKNDVLGTSTRLSDNLALFESDKLPSLFKYVDGAKDILVNMGSAAKEKDNGKFEELRTNLYDIVDKSNDINSDVKRDLKNSVATIDSVTPKFNLGSLAGEISSISSKESKLLIDIEYNEFDNTMQNLFDMGQRQTKKFLESYGIEDYTKDEYDIGDFLTLRVNKNMKENARGVTRNIPIEEDIQNDGITELGSIEEDVMGALKSAGFFKIKTYPEG